MPSILLFNNETIAVIITVILGGGLFSAIAAFKKAKPEAAKITVEVAGQAVIVQKGVIDSLQGELLRQGSELKGLESDYRKLEGEHETCLKENREFRRTIDELKQKISNHNERLKTIENNPIVKGENIS